jgi:hypothetical protein
MELTVLGDVHGKWRSVNSILNHESENRYALSTGDLCSYEI